MFRAILYIFLQSFICFKVSLLTTTYLMPRSYPKYYQTRDNCTWHVLVPPHQRIIARILDLQTREDKDTCRDKLSIGDTSPVCGELGAEILTVSHANTLTINFETGLNSILLEP